MNIPATISFPIIVGGIPFHVDLGGGIEFESMLSVTNTAMFKGRSAFSGSTVVQVKGGKVSTLGKMPASQLELDDSDQFGLINAGFRTMVDFPKAGIGVGWKGFLSTCDNFYHGHREGYRPGVHTMLMSLKLDLLLGITVCSAAPFSNSKQL